MGAIKGGHKEGNNKEDTKDGNNINRRAKVREREPHGRAKACIASICHRPKADTRQHWPACLTCKTQWANGCRSQATTTAIHKMAHKDQQCLG